MKKLLILVLLFYTPTIFAEDSLVLGGFSYHNNRDKGYNETHYTTGIEYNDFLLMYYYNSNKDHSIVLGKYQYLFDKGWLKAGVLAGVVTGYSEDSPVLAILPTFTFAGKQWAVDVVSVPSVVTYAQFRLKTNFFGEDSPTPTHPEDRHWAVGYSYGVVGGAFNLWWKPHSQSPHTLRLEGSDGRYEWETQKDWGAVEYWVDQNIYGLYYAYEPFNFPFALEAGLVYNDLHLNARAIVQDIEAARATQEWDTLSQYYGVRLGSPWNKGLGFYAQLGTLRLSSPKLETSGLEVRGELELYDDIEWLPIVQFGMTHTF